MPWHLWCIVGFCDWDGDKMADSLISTLTTELDSGLRCAHQVTNITHCNLLRGQKVQMWVLFPLHTDPTDTECKNVALY